MIQSSKQKVVNAFWCSMLLVLTQAGLFLIILITSLATWGVSFQYLLRDLNWIVLGTLFVGGIALLMWDEGVELFRGAHGHATVIPLLIVSVATGVLTINFFRSLVNKELGYWFFLMLVLFPLVIIYGSLSFSKSNKKQDT